MRTKYKFGMNSLNHRKQVINPLVRIVDRALAYGIMDFSLIESIRSKEKQNKYFMDGRSKLPWPKGNHNVEHEGELAKALDIVPCINGKLSWKRVHCLTLSGIILAAAVEEGIKLRWGGNWDMDGEPITDQDYQDLVHYEVVGG
jgi:peptidoglycan L-alanyl-D-glutamate endopeptidase CwlK